MSERKTRISRSTELAEVKVALDLDGAGRVSAETDIPFIDQMLVLFAREGQFDMDIRCSAGDADADSLVEEIGFCLGLAFDKALGAHKGIACAGSSLVAVEDILARAVVEAAGHSRFVLRGTASAPAPGGLESGWIERFWRAFVGHARMTLHLEVLYGGDGIAAFEALFKAAGRALKQACAASPAHKSGSG